MSIQVRSIEVGDEAAWRILFQDYIDFYEASVPESVIDLTWRRLLAQADGMAGLVAVTGSGRVIGLATMIFHRSTWSPASYCYLEDLFVDPSCRGTGAGRALIEAVYAEADKRGATRTYWATDEANSTARQLYDRIGVLTHFLQYRR